MQQDLIQFINALIFHTFDVENQSKGEIRENNTWPHIFNENAVNIFKYSVKE